MYEEYFEILKPLPKLNKNFYKNEDLYSEGDVEDLIVDLIVTNEPEDYTEAVFEQFSFNTYYHLSPLRKNILNWYPFRPDAEILEIGCGMGAVTSVLCEKAAHVTSVELSERRASATVLRLREQDNLEVIVGNINDIVFDKKFDYITLIGVLEYQGSYTEGANPYLDFLKKVKGLLKPDGHLLIAIENKYGLKYWCGSKEDHTGVPFDGINDYRFTGKKVRTFANEELRGLTRQAGFENAYFYYPLPDYKLPNVIYSEGYLPKADAPIGMHCYNASGDGTLLTDENLLYKDVIANGAFSFMANSFLVDCYNGENAGERVTFAALSSQRDAEYRVSTCFLSDGTVRKAALTANGCGHIAETVAYEEALRSAGLSTVDAVLSKDSNSYSMPFREEKTAEEQLMKLYRDGNREEILLLFDRVYEEIQKSSDIAADEENILCGFDLGIQPDRSKYGVILKKGYLDMIPRNAFWSDNGLLWFDQEWMLENVPASYILYRGLNEFFTTYKEAAATVTLGELVKRYNLLGVWKEYELLDNLFMGTVANPRVFAMAGAFTKVDEETLKKNVRKLLIQE